MKQTNTMQAPESDPLTAAPSLSRSLHAVLLRNPAPRLPLDDFLDAVAGRGFGLLLMVLALPSALPVPAPGYSVPFGLLIALLGLQMICGRTVPWLPARVRRWTIRRALAERMVTATERFFKRLECWIKPRLSGMSKRRGALCLQGGLILFMALLMCVPIPLTNTAPAMVIFLLGLGISEADGYITLAACMLGIVAALLYLGVIAVAIHLLLLYGPDGLDQVLSWINFG